MKKLLIAVVILALLCSLALPAFAATVTGDVVPMWENITLVGANLEIGSVLGIAECSGRIVTGVLQPVKVVVRLQQKVNGSWTTIKTWTETGTRSAVCLGSYAVARGYEYRVYTVGYLYDNNGVLQESGYADYSVDFS